MKAERSLLTGRFTAELDATVVELAWPGEVRATYCSNCGREVVEVTLEGHMAPAIRVSCGC